jgi:hypothetical protein
LPLHIPEVRTMPDETGVASIFLDPKGE